MNTLVNDDTVRGPGSYYMVTEGDKRHIITKEEVRLPYQELLKKVKSEASFMDKSGFVPRPWLWLGGLGLLCGGIIVWRMRLLRQPGRNATT